MIRSINSLFFLDRIIHNFSGFGAKQISTLSLPLQFKASPALWGEPPKKKKKIDPAIIKAREERKKKRIAKEIRKLMRLDKQLKPIAEFSTPECLIKNLEQRKRNVEVSDAVTEERILILKDWTKMKYRESKSDFRIIWRLIRAQSEALNELRSESEELYQAAVKIDSNLIPLKFTGPTETPMKEDYPYPDGSYIDVSKKWN